MLNEGRTAEHIDTDPTPRDVWAPLLDEVCDMTLEDILARVKRASYSDLSKVRLEQFYDAYNQSNYPNVRVMVLRKETEAEVGIRVRAATYAVNNQNARELAEFERLKKKFGGGS